MEIEVVGNSGCKVEVVRDDTKLFVLKSSDDPKYLSRLALQAEKQQKAFENKVPNIIVPKVYAITRTDQKTEIRMDYVYSQNYIDYMENAGVHEIDSFVEAMIAFVENEIAQSPLTDCSNEILMAKFEDVVVKVAARADYSDEMCELINRSRMRVKVGGGYASHSNGSVSRRFDVLQYTLLRTAILPHRFSGFVYRNTITGHCETAPRFTVSMVVSDVSKSL